MSDFQGLILILGPLWLCGLAVACFGYYLNHLRLPPTPWRIVAAIFWPVGIPLDYVYRRRHK